MAAHALVFDVDGTLWCGHAWYASVLAELVGADRDAVVGKLESGQNVFRIARDHGVEDAGLVKGCRARADGPALYDGVVDTLDHLRRAGRPLGVVTSLSRRLAEPLMTRLGLDAYFGAVEFAARKPNPVALLRALAALGVAPGPAHYYVGDTANDATCAARAAIGFAWASWGYGEKPGASVRTLARFAEVLDL
jgi:phosphoglycolate phosphatase-like HAD superfamily hydrolase